MPRSLSLPIKHHLQMQVHLLRKITTVIEKYLVLLCQLHLRSLSSKLTSYTFPLGHIPPCSNLHNTLKHYLHMLKIKK